MPNMDIRAASWHKSTRSGANGACVEVADNLPGVVLVRDTKDHGRGHILGFGPDTWVGFVESCKAGEFNPQ